MNLLAIETSTDACSVGLSLDGEMLLDHRLAAQQHGALVLPMIDALLLEAGIKPNQLDALIFGQGPGSFTGVRIGVALTQGIAVGADVGVVGISTLQSVAQGCRRLYGDSRIAVCLDARMDEVYFGAFTADAAMDCSLMQPAMEERLLAPRQLPHLPELTGSDKSGTGKAAGGESMPEERWYWAGSGAERYQQHLAVQFGVDGQGIRFDCWPHAQDLLSLGAAQVRAGKLLPAEMAMPVYLRDKVAQTTEERMAARATQSQG